MSDDEFAGRDHQGLQPAKKDGPKDDAAAVAAAHSRYMRLYFLIIPCVQQALAWSVYFALSRFVPGQKQVLDAKFAFLHEYDLGYVFLAVWIVSLARNRVSVNANAARAGARVDRPDQHVYKIMDSGAKADAPFVLMANTGHAGRFNRAQVRTILSPPLFVVCPQLTQHSEGSSTPTRPCLSSWPTSFWPEPSSALRSSLWLRWRRSGGSSLPSATPKGMRTALVASCPRWWASSGPPGWCCSVR